MLACVFKKNFLKVSENPKILFIQVGYNVACLWPETEVGGFRDPPGYIVRPVQEENIFEYGGCRQNTSCQVWNQGMMWNV